MKKEIRTFDFNTPFDPALIKTLKDYELSSFCNDIRKNLIENCAKNGGHLSSNLGVVELTVALHKFFDLPKDKIIFDVGHQSYTHKLLSGRTLENLRQKGGVSGFQKISESPYDVYEGGHSSTSISAAMGLALSRDLNKENYEIIAVIGDSSFANGVSFEALNHLANFPHKIIVIINDNDKSIVPSKGLTKNYFEKFRLSKRYLNFKNFFKKLCSIKIFKPLYAMLAGIKNFFKYRLINNSLFSRLGIGFISNIDGHDIKDITKALKFAANSPKSVIIHVTTTKGKGYEYAENDELGHWHGVGPFDIETGKTTILAKENETSWSYVYASLLKEGMANDEQVILISPGTTVGSRIDEIFSCYKNRCFDVGIAEEHASVFAAGIASGGLKPYVSVYSTFLQRAYDEISHDVARLNLNATYLVDRCGLPNSDGETHQGIFDISFLNSIPNVAIAMAKDYLEAQELFNFSLTYNYPLAIRYPRGNTRIDLTGEIKTLRLGEWKVESKGSDLAIITYGPLTNDIKNRYENTHIVNAVFQKPYDEDVLNSLLSFNDIIIADIYGTKEGFSQYLSAIFLSKGYKGNLHVFAIENTFIPHGSIKEQLQDQGLDILSLDKLVKDIKDASKNS